MSKVEENLEQGLVDLATDVLAIHQQLLEGRTMVRNYAVDKALQIRLEHLKVMVRDMRISVSTYLDDALEHPF